MKLPFCLVHLPFYIWASWHVPHAPHPMHHTNPHTSTTSCTALDNYATCNTQAHPMHHTTHGVTSSFNTASWSEEKTSDTSEPLSPTLGMVLVLVLVDKSDTAALYCKETSAAVQATRDHGQHPIHHMHMWTLKQHIMSRRHMGGSLQDVV